MKETILVVIFAIHAMAFAYFYIKRGHRVFNLLFCSGFILLVGYYGYGSYEFLADVEAGSIHLDCLRWAGLGLCAVATPFFVTNLVRKLRTSPLESEGLPGGSSETMD